MMHGVMFLDNKEKVIRKEFRKYKTYKLDIRNKEILLESCSSTDVIKLKFELNILNLKVEYMDNLIAPLPAKVKKIFYFALVENLPIYVVAERMGVTPNSISDKLSWNIKHKLLPRFDVEMFKDETVQCIN